MPLVAAKCLAEAWGPMAGTTQCAKYYPNRGPLEGGLYEIETGTALDNLTVPGTNGLWLFQYPGHEGVDPEFQQKKERERRKYEQKQRQQEVETPQAVAEQPKPKKVLSEAQKKKMADGRAKRKAARQQAAA